MTGRFPTVVCGLATIVVFAASSNVSAQSGRQGNARWTKGRASFNTTETLAKGTQITMTVRQPGWRGPLGVWVVGSSGYSRQWAAGDVDEGAVFTFSCNQSARYGIASQLDGFNNFAGLKGAVALRDGSYELTYTRNGDQRIITVRVWRGADDSPGGALSIRWGKGRASFNTSGTVPAGSVLDVRVIAEGWEGPLGLWRVGASDYLVKWSAEAVAKVGEFSYRLDRAMTVGISSQLAGFNSFANLGSADRSGSGYQLVFTRSGNPAKRVVHVTVLKSGAGPRPGGPQPNRPRPVRNPPTVLGVFGSPAVNGGVVVTDVALNSLAHRMGLQRGDRILRINGVAVRSTNDFRAALAQTVDAVRIVVVRGRDSVELSFDWR